MGKNNTLINQYKQMYKQINNITPQVYAAIAIALHRKGMTFEEIEEIFGESQVIWTECAENDIDMQEMCKNETGIDVLRTTNDVMEV